MAQPLLNLTGGAPELFIAHATSRTEMVAFAVAWALLLPALTSLSVLLVRWSAGPGAALWADRLAVIGWSIVVAGSLVGRLGLDGPVLDLALMLLGGAALATAVIRLAPLNEIVRLMAALPVVLVAVFLFASPSSDLVAGRSVTEPGERVQDPIPIVSVVFDEFPVTTLMDEDGELNAELFPNFARLAGRSDWFRNALSNSIATTDSLPIILSGQLDDPDAPTAAAVPDNLFTLLSADYEMVAVEQVTSLCPEELCLDPVASDASLVRSFSALMVDSSVIAGHAVGPDVLKERLPAIDGGWAGFVGLSDAALDADPVEADAVRQPPGLLPEAPTRLGWVDQMHRFVGSITPSRRGDLWFGHFITPHIPWRALPSGAHYPSPEPGIYDVEGVDVQTWDRSPQHARLGRQRHLLQAGFLDLQLGALLDQLERTGLWDSALVIVTADHGASFEPDTLRRWPETDNLSELYRIPLFVHAPGQDSGTVVDEPAFSVDIMATIVDAVGADVDAEEWGLDGVSLLDELSPDREHDIIHWCCLEESAPVDPEALDAVLAEQIEQIGSPDSWDEVAQVGPYAALVGSELDTLELSDAGITWKLDNAGLFEDLDPQTGVIPALVSGNIEMPDDLAEELLDAGVLVDGVGELLVAIDGQVVGTGLLERQRGATFEFSAMARESAFHPGAHQVTLMVPNDPTGTSFATGTAGEVASLTFTAPDGTLLDVGRHPGQSLRFSASNQRGDSWFLSGTSTMSPDKQPADEILVYRGLQLLASTTPVMQGEQLPVTDAAAGANGQFEVEIGPDDLPEDRERLVVVARFGELGRRLDVQISRP